MATKGNSNRTQKNGVRVVLATAATVMTLLGAQSLAFAGKSTSSDTTTQTNVAVVPTTDTQSQLTPGSQTDNQTDDTFLPSTDGTTEDSSGVAADTSSSAASIDSTTLQSSQITVAAAQP